MQNMGGDMNAKHGETSDERLIGEITAALAIDALSVNDQLPVHLAAAAVRLGEAHVRSEREQPQRAGRSRNWTTWSGWLAAAAVLALWVGMRAPLRAPHTPQALRDSLQSAQSAGFAVTRLAWAPSTDAAALGAGGDVMWSNEEQRGVMRFVNLQPNDRTKWQYQLWIFDKSRDQRYPVDGGVFDIPEGVTEVLVPITARVPVGDAVLFAVTIEPPGGVVVSTRERIALLAKL